jgi:hypothetical protein
MLKQRIAMSALVALLAMQPSFAGDARPVPTGFADIGDARRLPTWSEPVRVQYLTFLGTLSPRAFALSLDGTFWAWQSGNENAMREALQRCDQRADQACQLYAVDDDVVWPVK